MKKNSIMCTLLASLMLALPILSGCSTESSPSDHSSELRSDTSVVVSVTEVSEPTESSSESSGQNSKEITPTLWKAENSDGNYIYMMGTIHIGDESTSYMPDYVENAYNYSDAIAVEADVDAVLNDSSKMIELTSKMIYKDGSTIKDHISKETYDGLVDLLTEYNQYSPMYDYYVPYFWESLLENLTYKDTGLSSDQGVDMVFLKRAKNDNKDVYEIEGIDYQLDMLTSVSDEMNDLVLKQYLTPGAIEADRPGQKLIYECWKNGSMDTALKLAETFGGSGEGTDDESKKLIQEYNDITIKQRNPGMAKKAEGYIDNGEKVFVLVGAAHFYGDNGIVELMKKDGYTVTIVK